MEEPLRSAKFAHLIATPTRPPRYPVFHPKLLPKFLMDYGAGWGNHRNRNGTAPPVLNFHPWGREMVPYTVSSLLGGRAARRTRNPFFAGMPRKHGPTYASTVFRDTLSVTTADPLHSGEENRLVTTGQSARNRTLVVVHLYRAT